MPDGNAYGEGAYTIPQSAAAVSKETQGLANVFLDRRPQLPLFLTRLCLLFCARNETAVTDRRFAMNDVPKLHPLHCPFCGGQVPFEPVPEVACVHCGEMVPIPEEHRAASQAAKERNEKNAQAEQIWRKLSRGKPPGALVFVLKLIAMGAALSVFFPGAAAHGRRRRPPAVPGTVPDLARRRGGRGPRLLPRRGAGHLSLRGVIGLLGLPRRHPGGGQARHVPLPLVHRAAQRPGGRPVGLVRLLRQGQPGGGCPPSTWLP